MQLYDVIALLPTSRTLTARFVPHKESSSCCHLLCSQRCSWQRCCSSAKRSGRQHRASDRCAFPRGRSRRSSAGATAGRTKRSSASGADPRSPRLCTRSTASASRSISRGAPTPRTSATCSATRSGPWRRWRSRPATSPTSSSSAARTRPRPRPRACACGAATPSGRSTASPTSRGATRRGARRRI